MKKLTFLFVLVTLLTCSNRKDISPLVVAENAMKFKFHEVVKTEISLKKLIDSLHIRQETIRVQIVKTQYVLRVFSDTLLLKTYPVVLGFNPIDDKLRQGDGCTPEGVFKIRDKYPHQWWAKFIWIDYPNTDSWKKHKEAKANGIIPQNAAIGGEVGIHGVPDGADYAIDEKRNWTHGCISLKNKDVNEIYPYITKSTLIEIKK